jgi:hypothetical protein
LNKNTEPLLWFGEDSNALLKKNRSSDFVMDSALSYYGRDDPKLHYTPGQLFLDNGAYTANIQNIDNRVKRCITRR